MQTEDGSPWDFRWLLLPVLGIAAWLRFWNLPSRGLLYWDEGKFALEGMRLQVWLQALTGSGISAAGKAVGTAKPTHALLIGLTYTIFGVHDYSALLLDAACSTVTVALIYCLGRRLFDLQTALMAAVLLALSEYDILYARSALSESDANLLFAAGVLLWTLAWRKDAHGAWTPAQSVWRVPAGVLLGASFTTNYRVSVYILVLVMLDLGLLVRGRYAACVLTGATAWAGGLLLAPLVWQVIGIAAQARGFTLFQSEITYTRTTYLAEAAYQIHGGKQSVFHVNPVPYVQWYLAREGVLMAILLVGGLILAAIRRTVSLAIPALLVAIPYVVYVFAPFIVPRNLDTAVPFAVLLSAATLVRAVRRLRASHTVRLAAVLAATTLLAATCAYHAVPLTSIRSGFPEAAEFLKSHHEDGAVATNEVMVYYLRSTPTTCAVAVLNRKVTVYALTHTSPYADAIVDVYDTPAKRFLLDHGHRIARYLVTGASLPDENPVASENGIPPGAHRDQHVDVYRIPFAPGYSPHRGREASCTLDRVT